MLSQARKLSSAYSEVVYHSNSLELIDYYSAMFGANGLDNIHWVLVGAK